MLPSPPLWACEWVTSEDASKGSLLHVYLPTEPATELRQTSLHSVITQTSRHHVERSESHTPILLFHENVAKSSCALAYLGEKAQGLGQASRRKLVSQTCLRRYFESRVAFCLMRTPEQAGGRQMEGAQRR